MRIKAIPSISPGSSSSPCWDRATITEFLIARGELQEGDGPSALYPALAKRVLAAPHRFIKAVESFSRKRGGGEVSLRPSNLLKLAVCAWYESNSVAGPAAGRGTMLDHESLSRSAEDA